jgi:hypothetical protein
VKDDGDLSGNGDLCLLHTDPLCEFHSPDFEGRPFLIKQNGRRLEQVGSEKTVSPLRYLAPGVGFSRLVSPRRKAELGADRRGQPEAGRIVDRVAEREGLRAVTTLRLELSSGATSSRPTLPIGGPHRQTNFVADRYCGPDSYYPGA